MNFLEKYRPGFLSRTRREKLLAALFLVVMALIWFSTWTDRLGAWRLGNSATGSTVAGQDAVLRERDFIEENYTRAIASVSNIELPDHAEVQARIQELAQKHSLSPSITPRPPTRHDRLTFHAIDVSFNQVNYPALEAFQREITKALPTVNLKTIKISANQRPNQGAQLTARFTFEAIEFNN